MKHSKSFIEEELERERKLVNPSKPGFKILNRLEFIFVNRPIQQAEDRRKAIEKAKADYRYGVEYFTVTDESQLVNIPTEAEIMSADDVRRLIDCCFGSLEGGNISE